MGAHHKNRAGFSLIEVLFAMLFLSVIVFGVIKLQTSNMTLTNTRQNELEAHFLATQGLEIVKALGKSEVGTCNDPCYLTGSYSLSPNGSETIDDLFERSFTKEDIDGGVALLVTATVGWEDSSGPHSVSAKRIIFE
ncbi:MAG: hypothetical protein OEY44_03930 [Candidatus Peregrinibacteria bacterium]|nr:hypothetical protein [Candidatus Peregrinibacteria bacterium]